MPAARVGRRHRHEQGLALHRILEECKLERAAVVAFVIDDLNTWDLVSCDTILSLQILLYLRMVLLWQVVVGCGSSGMQTRFGPPERYSPGAQVVIKALAACFVCVCMCAHQNWHVAV